MAEALLEAYRTGTPAAMERHWALTWHRRNHQAMRTYVQLDLGRQAGAADQDDDITLDDAPLSRRARARIRALGCARGVPCAQAPAVADLTAKPVRALRRRAAERRVGRRGIRATGVPSSPA